MNTRPDNASIRKHQTAFGRRPYDNPLSSMKAKAESDAKDGPRSQMMMRHYEAEDKQKRDNVDSERKLADEHKIRREQILVMHGGAGSNDPFRLGAKHHEDDEKMKREMTQLKAHNRSKLEALKEKNKGELDRADSAKRWSR